MAWIRAIKEADIEKLVEYLRSEQFESAGHLDMNDVGKHLRKFLSEIEIVEPEKEPLPKRYITLNRKIYEIFSVKRSIIVDDLVDKPGLSPHGIKEFLSSNTNGIMLIEILTLKRKGIMYTTFKYPSGHYDEPTALTL